MSLDELNEKEDDIDEEEERIFEEYRLVYNNLKTTLPDALMFILCEGGLNSIRSCSCSGSLLLPCIWLKSEIGEIVIWLFFLNSKM